MPRVINPKPCACGCGGETRGGDFLPGHDQRLRAAIEEKAGGLLNLKQIVETAIGKTIDNSATTAMGDRVINEVGQFPALSIQRNKGDIYRIMCGDWTKGSMWVVPQPSNDQYRVKLNGDALASLGGHVMLAFGVPYDEDQGAPQWRIKSGDLPQLITLAGRDAN